MTSLRLSRLLAILSLMLAPAFADMNKVTAPNSLVESRPQPNPAAVVRSGNARFTVLSPALIRMEWSAEGAFEDRASFAFIHRDLPAPDFAVKQEEGDLIVGTGELTLRYKEEGGRFDRDNLSVTLNRMEPATIWRPGIPNGGNLGGTVRTLDQASGAVPLDEGLISRDGWALVDDSGKPVFSNEAWPWATERDDMEALDWYLFGHGHDYVRALQDYALVGGAVPIPPRYILGSWWSRYWDYSEEEFKALVGEFERHDVPLDVLVVDMDWHLPGWTGYTWNRELFPDPEGFLDWVHEQGLHTTLNLHPHEGVGRHEEAFEDFAEAMALNPEVEERIPFQITDPKFVAAYFKYLHHPLESIGVDFWWLDWQQWRETEVEGLDPLTWLNYLHWTDMARNPERDDQRPLIFSRWGGLGNHRYQIGFSGDTFSNWESLAFQPHFTATAGNVLYSWWSHDIGGHQPGPVGGELYARWIQWGALSPILRTHGTKNPEAERRIWAFGDEVFQAAREAFRLRYRLVPYLYTVARQNHDAALPMIRPLYYSWPELEEAYSRKDEYMLGDDLLVVPVARPMNGFTETAVVGVWFPPGDWTDWFTGEVYSGPAEATLAVPLDEIPLFVRGGAIIPTMEKVDRVAEADFDPLILNIFPGKSKSGETRVYEDDGLTTDYLHDGFSWLPVRWEETNRGYRVYIGPAEGRYEGQPEERAYEVVLNDVWPPTGVKLDGKNLTRGWSYTAGSYRLRVEIPTGNIREKRVVEIAGDEARLDRSLLQAGARGKRRVLEEVAEKSDLAEVDRLLDSAAEASSITELKRTTSELLKTNWASTLRKNSAVSDKHDAIARGMARLLGLLVEISAHPVEEGPALRVESKIRMLEPAQNLSGEVEVVAPEGWIAIESSKQALSSLSPGDPASLIFKLNPGGDIFTPGTLRVIHRFSLDDFEFEMPAEMRLFPSVSAWWIVGPFDAGEMSLRHAFGPEEEGEIDLSSIYGSEKGEELGWQEAARALDGATAVHEDFIVDFHERLGAGIEEAVAYAVTWIESPEARDAILWIGSDDGVLVRLNGEVVHRNDVGRPYAPKQDRVPIRLNKGRNELLLKISQGGGEWRFAAWLESSEGELLSDVRIVSTAGKE